MKKIDRLRKEALEACRFRGHKMTRFIRFGDIALSHCRICEKAVGIDAHPLPNGIEIGGEAVALSCKTAKS